MHVIFKDSISSSISNSFKTREGQRKWDSSVKSGRRSWSGRKRHVTERGLRGSHKTANILESHGVVVGKARIAFRGLPSPRFRQWHFNRASDSWRSRVFLRPLVRVATLPEPTHSSSSFRVTRGCEFYVYEFTCRPACRNEHRTRCGHTDTLSPTRARVRTISMSGLKIHA